MKRAIVATLALAWIGAGCSNLSGEDRALLGTWVVADAGGGAPRASSEQWTFGGDGTLVKRSDGVDARVDFVTYPNTDPKGIDLTFINGLTSTGIYRVEGDLLRLHYPPAGFSRPRSFPKEEGSYSFKLRRRRP